MYTLYMIMFLAGEGPPWGEVENGRFAFNLYETSLA